MSISLSRTLLRNISKNFYYNFTFRSLSSSCFKNPVSHHRLVSNSKFLNNSRAFSVACQLKNEKITLTITTAEGVEMKKEGDTGQQLNEFILDTCNFDNYGVCGGTVACSTCHVIFEPDDYKKLPKILDEELDILCYAPSGSNTSRLACTLKVEKYMDGMKIQMPSSTKDQR